MVCAVPLFEYLLQKPHIKLVHTRLPLLMPAPYPCRRGTVPHRPNLQEVQTEPCAAYHSAYDCVEKRREHEAAPDRTSGQHGLPVSVVRECVLPKLPCHI